MPSTSYWVQWDPTNKKWIVSSDQGSTWADLVERPLIELLTANGIAAPAVSGAGTGRIYFDSTANKFKASQNGGAYGDLITTFASPLSTKGDIYVFGSADARLPIGTDTYILEAASGETLGLKWAAKPKNPVVLYHRNGDIVATNDTVETVASTYSLDTSLYFAATGDTIRIEQWVRSYTNTNYWGQYSYYGTQSKLTWYDLGFGGSGYNGRILTDIVRTGASAQEIRSIVQMFMSGSGSAYNYCPAATSGTVSNSGSVTVKTTLKQWIAGYCRPVEEDCIITYIPAP